MPLRRLTRLSRIELESERDAARSHRSRSSTRCSPTDGCCGETVSDELADVAKSFTTPRRTVLLESAGQPVDGQRGRARGAGRAVPGPAVVDRPAGAHHRRRAARERRSAGQARRDRVLGADHGARRGRCRDLRRPACCASAVLDLPALPRTASAPNLAGGGPAVGVPPAGQGRAGARAGQPGRAGHRAGHRAGRGQAGRRRLPEQQGRLRGRAAGGGRPGRGRGRPRRRGRPSWSSSPRRRPAPEVRGAGRCGRRAGPPAAWPGSGWARASRRCSSVPSTRPPTTCSSPSPARRTRCPAPCPAAPRSRRCRRTRRKGRATGGVRCQRFLRGEDRLVLAWAGPAPGRAASAAGVPVQLPDVDQRRDASGTELPAPVAAVG